MNRTIFIVATILVVFYILYFWIYAPNVHDDEPNELAKFNDDIRYPGTEPPAGTTNLHGELEYLGNQVFGTHWFVDVDGITWHFVTAGNPADEPILFIHGFPESWHAFHHQMADLADDYYVIAVDQPAYGQSDKSLDIDYSHAAIAESLAMLLDKINIDSFKLVAHDRGSVVGDHLISVDGMSERVEAYVRMQQSASEPHGYPRPPHALMGSRLGTILYKSSRIVPLMYSPRNGYVSVELSEETLKKLDYEFKYKGLAEAIPLTFVGTNFDKELADRKEKLFANMTMPVLFLQGEHDPGQHPEEYAKIDQVVADGYVHFMDASHFLHLEKPDEVSAVIREFISR